MAFVPVGNGSGYWLTITLVDTQNDRSTLEYELTSADFATAQTDAVEIIESLEAVTDAEVSTVTISFRREEDDFTYPAVACNNSEKARIVLQLLGSTKKATLDIPSPKPAIFQGLVGDANKRVNLLNTAVVDYINNFQSGGEAFISDGENSDFAIRGERVTSRKGMSRG